MKLYYIMTQNFLLCVSDLQKLYQSKNLDPNYSAQSLQDKVQFDIRFYFVRRANENIDKFTKKTFILEVDPNTGIKYIRKDIDEQTKNHQCDTEMQNSTMPETPNSELCLVKSFLKYLSKLHPRSDYLWQQPKKEDIRDSDIWFKPLKIGPNPLASFMSRISHAADLSRVYTNHSIRTTAMTFLGRANFTPKQIMSVTGHKSLNSLAVYQKVSENEKIVMGLAMNAYLHDPQRQIMEVQQPKYVPIAPRPKEIPSIVRASSNEKNQNVCKEIIAYEPEDPILQDDFNQDLQFDVESVLQEIEQESVSLTQMETSQTSTSMVVQKQKIKKSPVIPLFNNCKIGTISNLHIHGHKN